MVEVNYLAVLVAAAVNMALGALWYSPALFGKMWMRLMGLTEESMKAAKAGMWKRYLAGFVSTLVMAYVLAHFLFYAGAATVRESLQTAFWAWLGFVATVGLGMILWENKPWKLYALTMGFQLVGMLAMATILVAWR